MRVIVGMLIIGCLIVAFSIGFTSIQPARATDTTLSTCDFASLTAAVDSANDGGGTINITCIEPIMFDNELIISTNVIINGNGITLNGGNRTRFFTVNEGALLTLNNLTLQNGNAGDGGAILNSGNLIINYSIFSGNRTGTTGYSGRGGAIYNKFNATLTITNSAFHDNQSMIGGAIWGGDLTGGSVTISNSTFTRNRGNGSAISGGRTLTISNSTFSYNVMDTIRGHGILTISNSNFIHNFSINGAIDWNIRFFGAVTLINNYFFNNQPTMNIIGYQQVFSQDSYYMLGECVIQSYSITDNGGNVAVSADGCPNSKTIDLTLSTPTCNPTTNSMEFAILTGDGTTFAVTGTGPGIPATMNIGTNTLPAQTVGPNTWNLTITETVGNSKIRQSRPISITCAVPVDATAVCDGDNLIVEIVSGDPNFNIADARGILLGDAGLGVYTIPGPISTQNLRVSERNSSRQTVNLGNLTCGVIAPTPTPQENNGDTPTPTPDPNINISASAVCVGSDLQVNITNGDDPFTIHYGLGSTSGNGFGVFTFAGPATFNNVTITEQGGDGQSLSLGNFDCRTVVASAMCVGFDLQVSISNGNAPFTIHYGLGSTSGNGLGVFTFSGPAIFNNVTVTEQNGDMQSLSLGNFNCTRSLVASANCAFVNLQVTISDGDGPFIINYGLGSTSGNPTGVFTFSGPAIFNNVTVTEQGGDGQSISLGSINCYFPLIAYAACSGNDMIVVITAGDGPFTIQYNGLTLPNLSATPHLFPGPGTFTNVAVLEQGGDLQSSGMGNITCP